LFNPGILHLEEEAIVYSFDPTEEQKMLVDTIQRFSRNDLRPAAHEADEENQFPHGIIEKGWELGILQASIPEDYGGFGEHSAVTGVLAAEELAWGDIAGAMAVLTPGLFALPILIAGNQEQKEQYLPLIIDSEWKPYTAALIEPHFDFDPGDLHTEAKERGESYQISGEKVFVPFADRAKAMIVYAVLEGQTQGFIVPKDVEGLRIGERQKLMGVKALPVYKVFLENVHIPKENRLGGPGGHSSNLLLDAFRIAVASLGVGLSRAAFDYARDYAKDREAFGVKIAQKQSIAFMLAEMATEIEAIRLLTWEAAWMIDNDIPGGSKMAYLAHTGAADMAMMVTDRSVQILGGHGYIREHPVEMWMRSGRGIAAFTGIAIV
jgi:alkylation response protein AidB-like acyl-CoA dehydrogenase